MKEHMLTTIDNPYDPFTQPDEWYAYDIGHDHHTMSFLSRIARSSDDLSDEQQKFAIETAIDEIVKENISGIYRKVSREVKNA